MNKLEAQYPRSELVAITIDEGITGYRSEALGIAKKCCEDLGIDHRVYSFQKFYGHTLDEIAAVAMRRGTPFICSYCGILRRKALNIAARKEKATKLATAHNLDDEVQSMVMNLLRGDLATMARVGSAPKAQVGLVPRIKPMCEIPEREVTLYAYLKKITFQSLPCQYLDTSLRSDVRRFLNQMEDKHPGMKFTLYRSFEKIRPHLQGIKQSRTQGWCEICGEPTTRNICMACYTLKQLDLVT